MEVKICDLVEAREQTSCEEWDYVVSISEFSDGFCSGSRGTMKMHFYDIAVQVPGAPTRNHIEALHGFYRSILADGGAGRLLIHCTAGISRSTAAALLFYLTQGLSIEESIDEVLKIRDIAHPNRLMVALIDDLFKLEGELVNATIRLSGWP